MNESILVLKPGFEKYKSTIDSFIRENNLNLVTVIKKKLNRSEVVCLYPEIFRPREDDTDYGEGWKYDTIDYLTSGVSVIYHIQGEGVMDKTKMLKYELRQNEGKCVKPPSRLSREEFINTSIKNIIHTVDESELGHIKWLFGFEKTSLSFTPETTNFIKEKISVKY